MFISQFYQNMTNNNPIGILEIKRQIQNIMKIDKKSSTHNENIKKALELSKYVPQRGKILLGLWERADSILKKDIFELLKEEDFADNHESKVIFKLTRLRMGESIDLDDVFTELEAVRPSLRIKAQKILCAHGYFTKNRKYRLIQSSILNHINHNIHSVYTIENNVIKLKTEKIKNSKPEKNILGQCTNIKIEENGKLFQKKFLLLPADDFLAHLKNGDFHRAHRNITHKIKSSLTDHEFSLNQEKLSFLLRSACIPGPIPRIFIFETTDWHDNFYNRQVIFRKHGPRHRDYKNYISLSFSDFRRKLSQTKQIVYFFYEKSEELVIYDLNKNIVKHTGVKISEYILKLRIILEKSKKIIQRDVTGPAQVQKWWSDRYKLDTELRCLLTLTLKYELEAHCFICLDENLTEFPFENISTLEGHTIMRLPSSEHLPVRSPSIGAITPITITIGNRNTDSTKTRVSAFRDSLEPAVHAPNAPIHAFFGHGSGIRHTSDTHKLSFLFGCSSTRLVNRFNFRRIGIPTLFPDRSVVGCLWSITDFDIDTFGIAFLKAFVAGGGYCRSRHAGIAGMRMKWLNGAAIVCYSRLML